MKRCNLHKCVTKCFAYCGSGGWATLFFIIMKFTVSHRMRDMNSHPTVISRRDIQEWARTKKNVANGWEWAGEKLEISYPNADWLIFLWWYILYTLLSNRDILDVDIHPMCECGCRVCECRYMKCVLLNKIERVQFENVACFFSFLFRSRLHDMFGEAVTASAVAARRNSSTAAQYK